VHADLGFDSPEIRKYRDHWSRDPSENAR